MCLPLPGLKGIAINKVLFSSVGTGIKLEEKLGQKLVDPVEEIRPQGYKTFFMLNSAEHEIYPSHKC